MRKEEYEELELRPFKNEAIYGMVNSCVFNNLSLFEKFKRAISGASKNQQGQEITTQSPVAFPDTQSILKNLGYNDSTIESAKYLPEKEYIRAPQSDPGGMGRSDFLQMGIYKSSEDRLLIHETFSGPYGVGLYFVEPTTEHKKQLGAESSTECRVLDKVVIYERDVISYLEYNSEDSAQEESVIRLLEHVGQTQFMVNCDEVAEAKAYFEKAMSSFINENSTPSIMKTCYRNEYIFPA